MQASAAVKTSKGTNIKVSARWLSVITPVEWLERRAYNHRSLGSKPIHVILLCP